MAVAITSILLGTCAAAVTVRAQESSAAGPRVENPDHLRRLHHLRADRQAQRSGAAYRGLTISRPPEATPQDDLDADVMVDGPIAYNDIRSFNPAPYVDSGVQYPFGLDGIGGYGSDVGFAAASDNAIYVRRRP